MPKYQHHNEATLFASIDRWAAGDDTVGPTMDKFVWATPIEMEGEYVMDELDLTMLGTEEDATEEFVAILYYDHEPCRVYGPFPTEGAALDFLDARDDFSAATVHGIRNPKE